MLALATSLGRALAARRASARTTGLYSVATLVVALAGSAAVPLSRAAEIEWNLSYEVVDTTSVEKPNASFTLPAQGTDLKESLDDFRRLVKHEQWEKAFQSLETISKKTATGYVDRGDGVLVPSRQLLRTLLGSLPPAGKNAYRLFYDAQANALWNDANSKGEAERLNTIVSSHLISSVGDQAADRLGDLYFERGDFELAASTWQLLANYCPETKIPKAFTLCKLAAALHHAGRTSEVAGIQRALAERYGNEQVEIGGQQLKAVDYVARLSAAQPAEAVSDTAALPNDIALPESDEPLWRFAFQSKVDLQNPGNPFQLMDVYGRQRTNDFAIPAAVDATRAYVNVFGVEMAFELATGKLLWRSGKLHLLNLQNARQMAAPERYSITLHGERVWSVSRDPQQANQQGVFALITRDAASGKELFSSRRSLSSWSILGPPFFAGDAVYVGAHRNGQGRELSVLVLNASDGKLRKTLAIGNYSVDQNQLYSDRIARPSFVWHGDRLIVDTHSGAIVSVDPVSGTVDWGMLYESPAPTAGYNYNYTPPPCTANAPLMVGGLMFSKGMRSPRLLGVAADVPRIVWNRPVGNSAALVAADPGRLYLSGEELTAYDLQSQQLLWATKVPVSAEWAQPLVTKNRLYQFTSRGVCEVDKTDGRVLRIFRGADHEALGGMLYVAPQALITVSNAGITAYSLGGTNEQAKAEPAN